MFLAHEKIGFWLEVEFRKNRLSLGRLGGGKKEFGQFF